MPGVEVVSSRAYLTDPSYASGEPTRLFNLCRSYRYQSQGYYVSLLAEARGHRPMPDIMVMRDLSAGSMLRSIPEDIEALIQKSLDNLKTDTFELSIYFGNNLAERHNRLALSIFNLFRAPMLRAYFSRDRKGTWNLKRVRPLSSSGIPEHHREFVFESAAEYFSKRRHRVRPRKNPAWYLAILQNEKDPTPPSDEKAIRKFVRAAEEFGIEATLVTKDDLNRLPEYDALFIRETTWVNNHTYRFARRAQAEGLVVIDDPDSILRCTNKVFLAELLTRHRIRTPKTLVVHRDNLEEAADQLGLPLILKSPDSSNSLGVFKASTREEVIEKASILMEKSDLLIAQEFMPTPFDWRIGIIDGRPLYACKYYMAGKHWQIISHGRNGRAVEGQAETLPLEEVPESVLKAALRSASLIGNSLYGVDIKEINGKAYVIEVNDNPSIDSGCEDLYLKDDLYRSIMAVFHNRLAAKSLSPQLP